jgi:hypothetical protein
MSIFNLPEQQTALGHLSTALGTGIGAGVQQKLASIREEHLNNKEAGILEKRLQSLGPNATDAEVSTAILGAPVRPETKKIYSGVFTQAYRENREKRIANEHQMDRYKADLKALQDELKVTMERNRPPLKEKYEALKKERDQNYQRLREGKPLVFDVLEGIQAEGEGMPLEEAPQAEPQKAPRPPRPTKPEIPAKFKRGTKFDMNNAEHKAAMQKAWIDSGQDRDQANLILEQQGFVM